MHFIRFGFNKDNSRCERFLYGGCGGNGNNFATLDECLGACGGLNDPADSLICSETDCENHGLTDREPIQQEKLQFQICLMRGMRSRSHFDFVTW